MYGTVMKKERKNITSAVRSAGRLAGRENRTGIPTQLKERMERSTGLSFDDVRVHYNSALPARLDALAYTQGNQVEIAPGQERHLPHELGHVVQQKMGVVRANAMHSSGVAMNTDVGLERQADEIGAGKGVEIVQKMRNNSIIQRCGDKEDSPKEEEEDESQELESPELIPSSGSQETAVEVGESGSKSIDILEGLLKNPDQLTSMSAKDWYDFLLKNGCEVKPLSRGSLKEKPFEEGGGFKVNWRGDRILQYHPDASSHHGGAYYKLSSGKTRTVRISLDGKKV